MIFLIYQNEVRNSSSWLHFSGM